MYGMLHGKATTVSDAIKAYVQSYLNSPVPTYIELARHLWPEKWKKLNLRRPCCRLIRALCGHPEEIRDVGPRSLDYLELLEVLLGHLRGVPRYVCNQRPKCRNQLHIVLKLHRAPKHNNRIWWDVHMLHEGG